jgi:hypothetical protein
MNDLFPWKPDPVITNNATITGKGFGSVNDNIMVKIGGIECVVSSVTEQQIQCDISNVPVGVQAIMVTNKIKGHATNTNTILEKPLPLI